MPAAATRLHAVGPNAPRLAALRIAGRDREDMTYFTEFQPWLRTNNCCENTITDRVKVLTDFAGTHPDFPHCAPQEITSWLGRPGYAQWTRGTYYGHLRSFYTWACSAGLVGVDPMALMRRPKPGRSVPRPLSHAQVVLVLAAAKPVVAAWLTLGLYAGLRAHEIAKIAGEDVDQNQLYVLGKGGLGAFVPTHPAVWALAQVMPVAGWWFPARGASGHVSSMTISTVTSRLFAGCGIEGSTHRCRHTFAIELLRAGVNIRVVQTLMRHASLASTMIYTAVDEDERRDAIRRLVAA